LLIGDQPELGIETQSGRAGPRLFSPACEIAPKSTPDAPRAGQGEQDDDHRGAES